MSPAPAPVVERLANRNSVKPRLQGTSAPESANSFECTKEDFLRDIGGIGRIGKNSVGEVIYAGVVIRDEAVERGFRAGLKFVYELRFISYRTWCAALPSWIAL
jgi:hypothetical protein